MSLFLLRASDLFVSKKFCNGRINIILEYMTQFPLYDLRQ